MGAHLHVVTLGVKDFERAVRFYTDLGFMFPPFSFVGWSRGWTAEDMDRNIAAFQKSKYIDRSVQELVDNCVCLSSQIKRNPVEHMSTPLPKIHEAPSMAEEEYLKEETMRLKHIS